MRRQLFSGPDLGSQTCAYCGWRKHFGVMFSIIIEGQKFFTCSMECRDQLKDAKSTERERETEECSR